MPDIHPMNIHRFDLNLIVILHALLTERNVTKAAQRVYVSQPAASNALRRLRDILGDPLLIRRATGMALTPRALSLIGPVQSILNGVGDMLGHGASFDPKAANLTLHIAVSEYVAFVVMPSLLKDLKSRSPNIHLVVQYVDRENPLRTLRDNTVDLIIGFLPDPPRDLYSKTLFHDFWVCIHRKGMLKKGKRLTKAIFGAAEHVSLPMQAGGSAAYLQRIFREHGISRNVAVSIPHYFSIPRLVSSTDLLVTIPNRLALDLTRHMPLTIAKLPAKIPGFPISMFWHERNDKNAAHAWLRERVSAVSSRIARKTKYRLERG